MEEIKTLFFRTFRIADINEPLESRHRYLLERLCHIDAPFGLKGGD